MIKIKELRTENNLSQVALGEKIGVRYTTIGDWERGRAEPSICYLDKLATAFDVSVDYLIGREDDFGNIKKSDVEIDKTTKELLKILSMFNERQKERVLAYAEGVLESEKEYRRRIK